ncbi:hypothetical protein VTK26DRAFT_6759 [Humicola hyalothermophila]
MATSEQQKPSSSPWPWRGRSRRNSESSLTSLRDFVTGRRNSLSAVENSAEANLLRKRAVAAAESAPTTTTQTHHARRMSVDGAGTTAARISGAGAGPAGARNGRRQQSQSRPPPAFFNRTSHRHTFSASAVLRWYTLGNDEKHDALLKPPSPRVRSFGTGLPDPKATVPPTFPLQPWSLQDNIPIHLYPPEEQEFVVRTKRASAKVQHITGSQPGAKGVKMEPVQMIRATAPPESSAGFDRPGGYNIPRRLSNSSASSVSGSVMSGRDSFDSRMRSSSISGSQTSIDSSPPSPAMSWQTYYGSPGQPCPWQRPAPIKPYRRKAQGELFAALPGEVLELILEELRKLHLQPGSSSCATCWMRDCCSVAASARKFLQYAREALYRHIYLVGHEGQNMKKRTKTTYGSRMVLLRRTLRANPHIAVIVRSLKPPARPLSVGVVAYNDLVASVVMACPNLERLVGFYPTYDHSFQRLFQALSTRSKLKEMTWVLEPSPLQRQQKSPPTALDDRRGQGLLRPQEAQWFLGFHSNWKQLATLVVHCQPGATLSPPNLLECTIRSLPSLQNLYLSRIPHMAFNDKNLLSLPPLKQLSLTHCPGITTAGLSSMATRPASSSIQKLTLIHMDIKSLPVIARIFSYLTSLETFNMVQTYAPAMPPDEFMMLFPYLASQSLRKLHWDIPFLPDSATPADVILARSISAGGFPSLRVLCAPNDPEGLFQSLCAPRERIDHPADRYRGGQAHYGLNATSNRSSSRNSNHPWQGRGHTRNASSFSSTHTGGGGSSFITGSSTPPGSPLFPSASASATAADAFDLGLGHSNSNLHQARLAAQARLEAAQRLPRYFINVFDESGAVVEKHGVGAFIGTVESRIRYVLSPDPAASGATDEGGGLVTVEDMIWGDSGENLELGPAEGVEQGGRWKDKERKKAKGSRDTKGGEYGGGGSGEGTTFRREGCVGRWNTFSGAVVDKKDRERWWHQERGRWRAVVPS